MALPAGGIQVPGRRWFRHVPQGRDPLARAEPAPDGRWQRGTTVGALYLASDEDTAWAEWYRLLAELGIPPARALPREVWAWAVDPEPVVADLRAEPLLRRLGLAVPRPGRQTWAPYQDIGEALWREGWRGLVAPSAARPRVGLVLVLFWAPEGRVAARPIPPPRLVREAPVPPRGMTT